MKNEDKLAEVRARHDEMLAKHGFVVHYVTSDEEEPSFNIHTHGLMESFSHPDIQICLPITMQQATGVLHNVVDRIKKGEKFDEGMLINEIIAQHPICFVRLKDDRLRLILPDINGNLERGKMINSFNAQYSAFPHMLITRTAH